LDELLLDPMQPFSAHDIPDIGAESWYRFEDDIGAIAPSLGTPREPGDYLPPVLGDHEASPGKAPNRVLSSFTELGSSILGALANQKRNQFTAAVDELLLAARVPFFTHDVPDMAAEYWSRLRDDIYTPFRPPADRKPKVELADTSEGRATDNGSNNDPIGASSAWLSPTLDDHLRWAGRLWRLLDDSFSFWHVLACSGTFGGILKSILVIRRKRKIMVSLP
jgi:hypothetical protein